MIRVVLLTINGKIHELDSFDKKVITVKETDEIQVEITVSSQDDRPEIFIEDYQPELKCFGNDNLTYSTLTNRFFSESFGYAVMRIQFNNDSLNFTFDVLAKKTSAEQARKMIEYLASRSEELVKCCFARTSTAVGISPDDITDPETLLTQAESFIETLQSSRQELLNTLKKRLVPVRIPFWEADKHNCEIDPSDILSNLDSLSPTSGIGDIFIRGRYFEIGSIDVSSLQTTADVLENQILLGGLHSIRLKTSKLLKSLNNYEVNLENIEGYESFQHWMMRLTAMGMANRCRHVLHTITELIKLFEHRLKVKYVGEISPVLTAYARSSRIYRSLFTQLSYWYELGQPSLGGLNFLMKLKSLSKIYELFVFYKLIEHLQQEEWAIINAEPHEKMGEYMPSVVFLKKNEVTLDVKYEQKITRWNNQTHHLSLIDVYHKPDSSHPYFKPDYVLKFGQDTEVCYLILDAKYSTSSTVRDIHIPKLFEKYYLGTAVYDDRINIATNNYIAGVIAIYSLDMRSNNYISRWAHQGIYSRLPRLPMVGGVGLMTDNSNEFQTAMRKIFFLIEKSMQMTQ